jgi:hypothetical protein
VFHPDAFERQTQGAAVLHAAELGKMQFHASVNSTHANSQMAFPA